MDGTGDRREEEAGTPNPHTCSSSNRASIALAAIEQVWMVPAMGNPNPHTCDTRRRMKVQILSHQKSDATYTCFRFWLKEERLLSCPVEGEKYLWPLSFLPWLGHFESRRHPRLLKRVVPSPSLYHWPFHSLNLNHYHSGDFGNIWRVKSLKNSRVCE